MATNFEIIRNIPPGILLLRSIRGRDFGLSSYRYLILLVTFVAYACYRASRKPSSIVKSVLDSDPHVGSSGVYPWPIGDVFVNEKFDFRNKGWYPFNGKDGTSKLGEIDVDFLACYSLGMYVAGHLGNTLVLRLFLTTGMVGSGIFLWGCLGWVTFGISMFSSSIW